MFVADFFFCCLLERIKRYRRAATKRWKAALRPTGAELKVFCFVFLRQTSWRSWTKNGPMGGNHWSSVSIPLITAAFEQEQPVSTKHRAALWEM